MKSGSQDVKMRSEGGAEQVVATATFNIYEDIKECVGIFG